MHLHAAHPHPHTLSPSLSLCIYMSLSLPQRVNVASELARVSCWFQTAAHLQTPRNGRERHGMGILCNARVSIRPDVAGGARRAWTARAHRRRRSFFSISSLSLPPSVMMIVGSFDAHCSPSAAEGRGRRSMARAVPRIGRFRLRLPTAVGFLLCRPVSLALSRTLLHQAGARHDTCETERPHPARCVHTAYAIHIDDVRTGVDPDLI